MSLLGAVICDQDICGMAWTPEARHVHLVPEDLLSKLPMHVTMLPVPQLSVWAIQLCNSMPPLPSIHPKYILSKATPLAGACQL